MRTLKAILAGALWTGCGTDGNSGGVGLILGLDAVVATNDPDHFTIAGVSTSLTATRTYSWSCSKGQANLSIGATLTDGSIRLEAYDGAGALVHDNTYEATVIGGIDAVTKADGVPGTWRLRFTFDDALWSGALTVDADLSDEPDRIDIGGTGALDASWIFQPGWNAFPVDVSVGGMSAGSVRVRVWDGSGAEVYDQSFGGISTVTASVSGAPGVWMVQIDYLSAVSVGAVRLSQT